MTTFRKCSRCRQPKTIVHSIRSLRYCEDCKDHAPTHKEYDAWLNERQDEAKMGPGEVRRGSTTNVFGRSK